MRFMILRKADRVMPGERLLAAMGASMEDVAMAGVMRAGDGLQASAKGARVTFTKGRSSVVDRPFDQRDLRAGYRRSSRSR